MEVKLLHFFNLAEEDQTLSISSDKLGKRGEVRDLWRQKDIGKMGSALGVKVSAHGTAFFKVK